MSVTRSLCFPRTISRRIRLTTRTIARTMSQRQQRIGRRSVTGMTRNLTGNSRGIFNGSFIVGNISGQYNRSRVPLTNRILRRPTMNRTKNYQRGNSTRGVGSNGKLKQRRGPITQCLLPGRKFLYRDPHYIPAFLGMADFNPKRKKLPKTVFPESNTEHNFR